MIVAHGAIGTGLPAVIACFDFAFIGGSMGIAVGERRCCRRDGWRCCKARALIVVPASGGARMQEGILLADANGPRTTLAVDNG